MLGIKDFAIGVFLWVERIRNYWNGIADGFQAVFAPMRPVLGLLGDLFRQLGQAIGITSKSADDSASAFDQFGAMGQIVGSILGTLADIVLPVVVGAIGLAISGINQLKNAWRAIIPIIDDVTDVFSGLWDFFSGLFTGDWTKMWDGLIDTVKGAGMAIVHWFTGSLGLVAKMIDGFGSMVGKDFGLNAGLQNFLGSQETAFVNNGLTAANLKGVVGDPSRPAVADAIRREKFMAQSFGGAAPAADVEQHIHSHVTVQMDGEKVAEAHARAKRSAAARSFMGVPPAAEVGAY